MEKLKDNLMDNLSRSNKIELLNFEGPVLTASKNQGLFLISDEFGEFVGSFTEEEFLKFIKGDISITDSRGKKWTYPEESIEAKPKQRKLNSFVYDNTEREIVKSELIDLLLDQVDQLVTMSGIELSIYVQKKIKHLSQKINE